MELFLRLDTDPLVVIGLYPECISGSSTSPKLEGSSLTDAVNALAPYLTDRRTKASTLLQTADRATNSKPEEPQQIPNVNMDFSLMPTSGLDMEIAAVEKLISLLQQIDTTILKTYVQFRVSMVKPFVRIQNWCRVEDCARLLLEKKVFWQHFSHC